MAKARKTRRARPDPSVALFQIVTEAGVLTGERPSELSDNDLVRMYQMMRFIRLIDDRMLMMQRQGRISFYGACTGQEGGVIGSGFALQSQDWVFPALREGGVALLRGYDFEDYVAQLFGNAADRSLGRQMPCHYSDAPRHFVSLSSPIANQLPQAVGVAWAARIQKDDTIVLAYMGDGATSEGDFHVALSFAGLHRLPIVFVCQNNQWAISVPSARQTAAPTLAAKANAYGMEGVRVDGNDALAVYRVTRDAVDRARGGDGPTFIEALTYRIGAHSTSDDPTRYRDETITDQWREKCPIERLRKVLVELDLWDDAQEATYVEESNARIKETIARQETVEKPSIESLFDDVYSELPWHLAEQRDRLIDELEASHE